MNDYGYTLITSIGVNRLVFESQNNTVIKVARNIDKVDKNYDESAFWSKINDSNLFCPIVNNCEHYTWIEMKYCIPAPNEFVTYKQKLSESPWDIDDLHPDNIGGINDNSESLVCFDYHDVSKISN